MSNTALTDALNATTPGGTDTTDFLAALVGPDKKYKTEADLAKGYVNADIHIRELQDKLDDKTHQEGLLKEVITTLRAPNATNTANTNAAPVQTPAPVQVPAVTPEAISTVVDAALQKKEYERIAHANIDKSMEILCEAYGSKEAAMVAVNKLTANDKNLHTIVNDLSKTNPDACLRFITANSPPVKVVSNTPGVDKGGSAAAAMPLDGKLTYSAAQRIRKENPKLYKSPEFRAQMEKAVANAVARGEDFFAN